MPTLVLSTLTLSAERSLAEAARRAGWSVLALDATPDADPTGPLVCYVSTGLALSAAARFDLALLEPPLDLLARLPSRLLLREVQYARFSELSRLRRPAFVKPADPLNKCFDVGVYSSGQNIRVPRGMSPHAPCS